MYAINKHKSGLDKINPVTQLTHIFKSQLLKSIVDEGGGADFSFDLEKKEKILNQLLDANVVGITQKGDVIIEISPSDNLPELKNEVYRLIEKSFELVGGSTGKGIKTDRYNDENFKQLIVVKNIASDHLLLSGYRYSLLSSSIGADGELNTPMGHFFDFDQDVLSKLSHDNAIELGTAWVNKEVGRAAVYGLHGIRDGLVYLHDKYQNKYFIGKMTIPSEDSKESYSARSRDFSISYMNKFYSGGEFENKVIPKKEFLYSHQNIDSDISLLDGNFSVDEKNLREILKSIDPQNVNGLFPNMFPIYLDRINTLNYIGTIRNGNVSESGIIVDCDEIKEEVISGRQKNIEDWKSKFGGSPIKYGEYLKLIKSV